MPFEESDRFLIDQNRNTQPDLCAFSSPRVVLNVGLQEVQVRKSWREVYASDLVERVDSKNRL